MARRYIEGLSDVIVTPTVWTMKSLFFIDLYHTGMHYEPKMLVSIQSQFNTHSSPRCKKSWDIKGDFPVAERLSETILSSIYAKIPSKVDYVIDICSRILINTL